MNKLFDEKTIQIKGRAEYLVRTNDDGTITVFSIIYRKPTNRFGNYQQDMVYRTIKPGSRNYEWAVKSAQ